MDDTYVYTAVSSAACGVYLQVGEIYLIMGKWPPHPHIINYYYVSEMCSITLLFLFCPPLLCAPTAPIDPISHLIVGGISDNKLTAYLCSHTKMWGYVESYDRRKLLKGKYLKACTCPSAGPLDITNLTDKLNSPA